MEVLLAFIDVSGKSLSRLLISKGNHPKMFYLYKKQEVQIVAPILDRINFCFGGKIHEKITFE